MNAPEKKIIDLIRAVILGTDPPSFDNWEKAYKNAEKHGLHNFMAEIAPKVKTLSAQEQEKMADLQAMSVLKDAVQETEVEQLIRIFDARGIDAIMLKGWYIKQLYPRRDFRIMADTDIIIRKQNEADVHEILTGRGYNCVSASNKKDAAYTKKPFQLLEIHKQLFMYEDKWNDCFNLPSSPMYIWNRFETIDGYKHIYRMDDELFFVYMIAHIAKHLLDDGGIGVRAFIDIWVYLRCKPNLDYNIINRDLNMLGLKTFAEKATALTEYWFEGKPASPEVGELGRHIFECGVYGKKSFFVANSEVMRDGKKHGKLGYAYKRAFPGMKSMKVRYPKLEKKPWLLPAYYSKRLWYSATRRKASIKGELDSVSSVDYNKIQHIRELYKKIGLEDNFG